MKNILFYLFILILVFESCSLLKKNNSYNKEKLISKVWDLSLLNEQQTLGTGGFIIFLDSSTITGFDGCRIFNAKVDIRNRFNVIELSPSGNRACDSTNIESRFLNALKQVNQLRLSGKKLVFRMDNKTLMQFNERLIIEESEVTESINSVDSTK